MQSHVKLSRVSHVRLFNTNLWGFGRVFFGLSGEVGTKYHILGSFSHFSPTSLLPSIEGLRAKICL